MLNRCVPALLGLSLFAFGQEKPELTADQIVQKHIEALGGLDKLKAINTLSASGKATMAGGQMEAPMVMQMKRPSSMRMEMTIQGKKIVQAFDGTTAWMINPMLGSDTPQKASADDTQEMKDSADIDFSSLANYKEKGNTVELVGMEDVEGNPAYKLKVTKKNGRVEYDYLDAKTFLAIKVTTKRKQMGNEIEIDAYPTNYKPVNGVLFPFTVDQKMGGKSIMQLTIDKVDVNQPIDDVTFQFPEKPKTEPKPEPKS
jgi:outer membrane lipoprotein-sorting protein